jgi:hypothetical protein
MQNKNLLNAKMQHENRLKLDKDYFKRDLQSFFDEVEFVKSRAEKDHDVGGSLYNLANQVARLAGQYSAMQKQADLVETLEYVAKGEE